MLDIPRGIGFTDRRHSSLSPSVLHQVLRASLSDANLTRRYMREDGSRTVSPQRTRTKSSCQSNPTFWTLLASSYHFFSIWGWTASCPIIMASETVATWSIAMPSKTRIVSPIVRAFASCPALALYNGIWWSKCSAVPIAEVGSEKLTTQEGRLLEGSSVML